MSTHDCELGRMPLEYDVKLSMLASDNFATLLNQALLEKVALVMC